MADLKVLVFPDVLPWERAFLDPVVRYLQSNHSVELVNITQKEKRILSHKNDPTVYWIWASEWRKAIHFFSPAVAPRVFASVMRLRSQKTSLPSLFFKSLLPRLPSSVGLLTYSPINFRFFLEVDKHSQETVKLVPLPFLSHPASAEATAVERPFTVGTFAPFISDSNLHYFLNVAHYVSHRRPDVSFRILGFGPLYQHLQKIVAELKLDGVVQVLQTTSTDLIAGFDVFVHTALRNDHFGAMLVAAANKIPVLSNEISGAEDLIIDGTSGFVVPVHETKSMAELVLRLADNQVLRKSLGEKLATILNEKFSFDRVARAHETVLFKGASSVQTASAA